MAYEKEKQTITVSENSHQKIQDILPRKNRRDSLLAKIMGPRPVSSSSGQNAGGTFLRSLPLMRGKGGKSRLFTAGQGQGKPEKIIHLKKAVSSERASVSQKDAAPDKKRVPVSAQGRVLEKPLISEVSVKPGERTTEEADVSIRRRISPRASLAFGVLCAAGILIALSTIFARATISLESSVAELSFEGIRIEASTGSVEIDAAGKKIPASLIETAASLKREFSPSVKERVLKKATGTVRIYNAFSSAPQTLVARTRLQDPSGRIFFLKQRVTVPGAAIRDGKLVPRFVSVSVEAERTGAEFNIEPAHFTILGFAGTPKFGGFYAESSDPFRGGFEGEAPVVRQADIDAASNEVTAALFAQLKEDLERKIPSGAAVIPGAREIIVTALRKPKISDAGERFFVEADGEARAILIRMDDIFALLGRLALAPDSGKTISPEKSRLEFDKVLLSLKNHTLSFEVQGTVAAVSAVAPDEFRLALAGRTRTDAENILRLDRRVRAFGIGIFPPWRRTVPVDAEKIRILVRE